MRSISTPPNAASRPLHYILYICLLLCLSVPVCAQTDEAGQISRYADEYVKCASADSRLKLANDFFAYLLKTDYIDEPIRFPAGSHIDSVDVNVYYYIAEWHYRHGDFQTAECYLTHATKCMGVVDNQSKSDVYALLGATYFRMSAYDKAAEALNRSYELDKESGDLDRMSSTLNNIASVFVAAGKPQEAEEVCPGGHCRQQPHGQPLAPCCALRHDVRGPSCRR